MKIQNYKILIIILIIIFSGIGVYIYNDYKITRENTEKTEAVLQENNFSKFYAKQGNTFCSNVEDEFEQENIINDMLWILENTEFGAREIQKIQCANGAQGILIK